MVSFIFMFEYVTILSRISSVMKRLHSCAVELAAFALSETASLTSSWFSGARVPFLIGTFSVQMMFRAGLLRFLSAVTFATYL
jgi:hypothetical protein